MKEERKIGRKKSSKVYVENAQIIDVDSQEKQNQKPHRRHLSSDISTEQLLSDQLVDEKVVEADGDGDVDDDDGQNSEAKGHKSQGRLYRIESHSALSSLEAKNLGQPEPKAKRRSVVQGTSKTSYPCDRCLGCKEMPSLHFAAYSGHLSCLESLLVNDETKKTQELDKKSRTPLFYACAANRIDCCSALLSKQSQWLDLPDKQMDTPVHVCCFFGWHHCLQKLLDAGGNPHVRNAKGFKPSHIAKTKECLELLLSYGDDLLQGDKLGRSPLFVACARDRSSCVEYLCSWNHQTQSWMMDQEDQRGDRPIHAAACNGSVESLKTLLKYGADPVIRNAKALTARDLAISNNHQQCAELLLAAERDMANNSTWFAPANAVQQNMNQNNGFGYSNQEWSECVDGESGQIFYYNNTTGKCQWEIPDGYAPQNSTVSTTSSKEVVEDDGEYVWVKKKKHAVCVVTGKNTEWTAVQDPISKAIYYKNTVTGESQWEEPDAVRKIQTESNAHASQQASRLWDELNSSRNALATALYEERKRQLRQTETLIEGQKRSIIKRKDEIKKREEQSRLQQLLPRSSFIRKKKQSVMKMKPDMEEDGQFEKICEKEPALDIFLSTYLRLNALRDIKITTEKRLYNCIYHYYVSLVDPLRTTGISKSQFRTVLRDAGIVPNSAKDTFAPLKLHTTDLVFAQASRAEPSGDPHRQTGTLVEGHLTVVSFVMAMETIRERAVAHVEENNGEEIEDDEEWFLSSYMLPFAIKLGTKMLTQIRECKEIDLEVSNSSKIAELFSMNRQQIQAIHRHYTSQEPKLKLLTFRGLTQFAQEFGVVPITCTLVNLYHLFEAVNWISGNAHTEVISFEKFQQILGILAIQFTKSSQGKTVENHYTLVIDFLKLLESNGGIHRVSLTTTSANTSLDRNNTFFVIPPS